ncbi:hypothetical protein ACWCQL_19255 [Streptomyces sp. NPDC002073]|uniref:hypothetical protein n=1 Tax=Streptomyces sp. NBC_00239 TaxID=2903640 RepID=UPI002E2B6153|nr:hypothetical protein [Streptomyces sp. NBC_00239]
MRAIRTASSHLIAAGATAAALAFAAPAATAAGAQPITSFGFAITPSTVAPGGQVTLTVTGCAAAFATASSGVFDTVSIPQGRPVRVTVDRDARRGARYGVSFTCNGETGSADLTIATASTPTTSSTAASRGVRGGLGGSVSGAEPAEIAAGAALFLVAAAGTTYAVRRRTAARRH